MKKIGFDLKFVIVFKMNTGKIAIFFGLILVLSHYSYGADPEDDNNTSENNDSMNEDSDSSDTDDVGECIFKKSIIFSDILSNFILYII